MRLTDRLLVYLEYKGLTIYSFEKACGLGNGYLGKQHKGKGAMGSEVLEKLAEQYPDINLTWLITGKGKMIQKTTKGKKPAENFIMKEEQALYEIKNKLVVVLKDQIQKLEKSLPKKKSKS
ncbi:MAG TPA: hypothetical protein VF476_05045 [Chitinophagaceae bacterium]